MIRQISYENCEDDRTQKGTLRYSPRKHNLSIFLKVAICNVNLKNMYIYIYMGTVRNT